MHDLIYSIQVQSVELLCAVFFSIGSLYITWNCFWISVCKTSNNVLQISCCEFEYFSINKRYTSRRRQRNERTRSQNKRARIKGAFIHGKWHPQQSTYPWEVFSADLFAIFKAIYWGNCTWFNLSRLTVPFICLREFELDYVYLMTYCFFRKISGREIAGVWKLAKLVTAEWSTGDYQRWREMSGSDVNTSLY